MKIYHFTDSGRLPWILDAGELRPGKNRIGGFPDPDFLWATSSAAGDRSASSMSGAAVQGYRDGLLFQVRFTLDLGDFFPWEEVPARYPAWTAEEVERLERAAPRCDPSTWWCREHPLPRDTWQAIEIRSWRNNRWRPLPPELEPIEPSSPDGRQWLSVEVEGILWASCQYEDPRTGQTAFEIGRARKGAP